MRETMPFYLDVYLLDNLIIHYVLLWTVMKITKTNTTGRRLFLGGGLGTFYSFLFLFVEYMPKIHILYSAIGRVAFSLILIGVTYNLSKWKVFLKIFLTFYMVNFTFAGAALGIFYFTKIGTYANGIFYIEKFPFKTLCISIFISYILLKSSWSFLLKRMSKEKVLMGVQILLNGQKVTLKALVDTGNELVDPISQAPVIIAEFDAIKSFLPDEVRLVFYEKKEQDFLNILNAIENNSFTKRIRMIPFSSLGQQNGMLFGFKPDKFFIEKSQKEVENVIIGIYNHKLSYDDSYEALLHPDLIQ